LNQRKKAFLGLSNDDMIHSAIWSEQGVA